MSRSLRCIPLLLFCISLPAFSQSDTVSGTISTSTTWALVNSPIVVIGTVTIQSGVTLTIESGVSVRFNPGTGLIVSGKIVADGVTFTSYRPGNAQRGDWAGIEFDNTADITSVFKNNQVMYAGGGANTAAIFYRTGAPDISLQYCQVALSSGNGINTRASSPVIKNASISDNNGYGIFSDLVSNFSLDSSLVTNNILGGVKIPTSSSPTIKNTEFGNNGTGISIENGASPIIRNNSIHNNNIGIQIPYTSGPQPQIRFNQIVFNTTWGVLNSGTATITQVDSNFWDDPSGPYNSSTNPSGLGNPVSNFVSYVPWLSMSPTLPVIQILGGTISTATTWLSGYVYWIKAVTTFNNTLTIQPGVIVKFASGTRLVFNSTGSVLNAVGNKDSLIVFTSDKDDAYGGDTDTLAQLPSAGNWDRVELNGTGATPSVLKYCLFRFGGSGSNGNLYITSCSPSLSNIYSTNSSSYGIRINTATMTLDSLIISGNANYGCYFSGTTTATVRSSTFQGNSSRGIYADGTTTLNVLKTKILNNNSNGIEINSSTSLLQSLDSSVVGFNSGRGVFQNNASGPQRFSYNRVEGNSDCGFWIYNPVDTVLFLADTVIGNTQDGIVTTKANLLGNIISNNRYPIGLLGRVSTKYSGNTIVGNTFNKAVALRLNGPQFSDTLYNILPSGMTSYVLVENSSGGVASGQILVIQPGTIIKFTQNMSMTINGTLIAAGTVAQPIIFTSHRDSTYGGKTIALNDYTGPARGNWYQIQFNSTAGASILRNCIMKYGGGSNGILYGNSVTFVDTLINLAVSQSGTDGIKLYRTTATFSNIRSDSNYYQGIYIYGSSPGSDVKVFFSSFRNNGASGLYADDGSAFRNVSNCILSNNTENGITTINGQITQYYYGNTIQFNSSNGIQLWNPNLLATDVQIVGNNILDNTKIGILSTASKFVDNKIKRNNYPIGVWGKLGNVYAGYDSVTQNTFNNAIAIQSANIKDTLSSNFPAAITSKAYHVIGNLTVNASDTLVILPGTRIKFVKSAGTTYEIDVYGTLLSEGTKALPIIFTSWRDNTIGGNTKATTDTTSVQPGDWDYIYFGSSSGNSRVQNCEFRYGGGNGYGQLYFYSSGSLLFVNNLITRSYYYGIIVDNTPLILDTCTIQYSGDMGLYAYSSTNTDISLRGCNILNNGNYGIYLYGSSKLSLISGSTIASNANTGIYVESNSAPLKIVNSKINNNGRDGLYVSARNDAIDTLLLIAGTSIKNNVQIGAVTSRAYFVDDTIAGNQFALGVTGQLSYSPGVAAYGTEFGNVYAGSLMMGNLYDSIAVVEGNIEGYLGYSTIPGCYSRILTNRDDIDVSSETVVTIAPGAIFKMRVTPSSTGRVYSYGTVKAEGLTNSKIIFTSWRDDTYGGDTNKDTATTVPTSGDWDALYFEGSDSSHVKNAIVKYGGYYSNGAIYIYNNNSMIDSSTIAFNGSYGVYIYYGKPTLFANDIHNQSYGISAYYTNNAAVNYNNIYQNSSYGLYFSGNSTDSLDARSNYWGNQDTTGPLVTTGSDQNPLGTGNKIYVGSGRVLYRPWLNSRQGILYGDVSGNGQIAAYDASLVLRHDVGIDTLNPVQQIAADVDGLPGVTSSDASFILRYVVGKITGFPGIGKQSLVADAVSAFAFRIEKNNQPDLFDLVVHLNNPVDIYSSSIKFSFDTTLVTPLSMIQGEASDSMVLVNYFPKGKANVALAGAYPLNEEGDIVRFTFKLAEAGREKETILFTVNQFLLNGFDVTKDVGNIVLDVKNVLQIPTTFSLSQNYPNPFNPTTTVKYQVPEESRVNITIYNLLGQKVKTLVNDLHSAGYYTVQWNGTDEKEATVASGVYIYRIEARSSQNNKFISAKKMLLIK